MPDGTHYIGSLNADGQPHGQGASFHPDGKPEFTPLVDDADERKSGRWIDGKLNGPAVWMWINDDGDRFEGLFKNNQRDGPGAYSWKGGGQYEGEWAADHRAGLGARWSKDGKLTHCGRWDESKLMESCAVPLRLIPDGSRLSDAAVKAKLDHLNDSALLDVSGSYFVGELNERGQPHGRGASFYPDGSPCVTVLIDAADASNSGRWADGKLQGRATMLNIAGSGDRYDGMFKDGRREGLGVYSWASGSRFEGEFIAGKRTGLGAEWNKDGQLTHCGRWAESTFTESCAVPLRLLLEKRYFSAHAKNASLLFPSGEHFVGPINAQNQRHGDGRMFTNSGALVQSAKWFGDELQRPRKALLIGNDDYLGTKLHGCVNDATDLQAALLALGFRCTLLTNATKRQMTDAIAKFIQSLQPHDLVWIFFSGHGENIGGEQHLMPVDSSGSGVRLSAILSLLNAKGSDLMSVIVLDCCRATSPLSFIQSMFESTVVPFDRSHISVGSFLIAHSCDPGSVASETRGGRNGWYTECLLRHLSQPDLRLTEIFELTGDALEVRSRGKQRSWCESRLGKKRNFVLNPSGLAIEPGKATTAQNHPRPHPVAADPESTPRATPSFLDRLFCAFVEVPILC